MKKLFLLLFAPLLLSAPVMAQIARGYYRVQNFSSKRYIFLTDDKTTGMKIHSTGYDVDALRTYGPFSRVVSDPSTVFYIENAGGTYYNLKGQGKDVYDFVGRYINITPVTYQGKKYYNASGVYHGVEVFLADGIPDPDEPDAPGFLNTDGTPMQKMWDIIPVSATNDNNYFGITPEVTADGQRYAPFFASFPFTPVATGMKVYTVSKVDENLAVAVISEVQGKVAGGTPVVIACPGATPSDNRINIEMSDCPKPANKLSGEYFNSTDFYPDPDFYHYNAKPWNVATMRILGVTSTGKLGFVKSTTTETIPRNKAYLVVSANAPDEIVLMTQAEYDEERAKAVIVTARNYSREYGEANPVFEYDVTQGTMTGEPTLTCEATPLSSVGTYPIVISKGSVTNNLFIGVNGTLTVTKAPLTVTAKSYTIKQNEPLPTFETEILGFKNGETASVLTAQPELSCELPETTFIPVGTYEITVKGAEAENYAITHVAGTLTVTEADPVTLTAADATMVYGDALPEFTYTISGEVEGTPAITCEANSQSSVGTYDIVIAAGTITYPNLVLKKGTLTITKAPLTASVGNYKRLQGEPNPEFAIAYEGFKNGEDASVLTKAPTATCEATAESTPGFYDIVVSGGEAQNYAFTYVNGRLEVLETQGIAAVSVSFQHPADIFALDGRCIRRAATTTAGLPRGLYIVNGRKFAVR